MAGQGKYTVYAPESNAKNNLLGKLFPASPTSAFVGKEVDYRAVVIGQGNALLKNGTQVGDSYFGPGVSMDYVGSPDLTKVDWDSTKSGFNETVTNSGGPANSYTPDLSSPGPGKTDGTDKNVDPEIKAEDIKPNYVPGGPNTGTKNPAEYAKKVAAQILGVSGKMGSSDSSGG